MSFDGAAFGLLVLLVAAAGGVGAVLRYAVTALLARIAPRFPWGVLVVNVLGSALGGAVLGIVLSSETAAPLAGVWSLLLVTGFAGGFTTFSTFAVDTVQLAERDENLLKANLNSLANVVLGVGAAFAAFAIASALSA